MSTTEATPQYRVMTRKRPNDELEFRNGYSDLVIARDMARSFVEHSGHHEAVVRGDEGDHYNTTEAGIRFKPGG